MSERARELQAAQPRPAPSRVVVTTAGKTGSSQCFALAHALADKLAGRGPVVVIDLSAHPAEVDANLEDLQAGHVGWTGSPLVARPTVSLGDSLEDLLRLCADLTATAKALAARGWSVVYVIPQLAEAYSRWLTLPVAGRLVDAVLVVADCLDSIEHDELDVLLRQPDTSRRFRRSAVILRSHGTRTTAYPSAGYADALLELQCGPWPDEPDWHVDDLTLLTTIVSPRWQASRADSERLSTHATQRLAANCAALNERLRGFDHTGNHGLWWNDPGGGELVELVEDADKVAQRHAATFRHGMYDPHMFFMSLFEAIPTIISNSPVSDEDLTRLLPRLAAMTTIAYCHTGDAAVRAVDSLLWCITHSDGTADEQILTAVTDTPALELLVHRAIRARQ